MLKVLSIIFKGGLGLVCVAIALVVFSVLVETKPKATEAVALNAPAVVPAMRVATIELPMTWVGYGTSRPLDAADVSAEVEGRVIERGAELEAGSPVEAGAVLLRIDPTVYAARADALRRQADQVSAQLAALEVEEAAMRERIALTSEQVDAARRDLDRARDAMARGAGNDSQIDARVQSLQRDRVILENQREALNLVPSRREALLAQLAAAGADLRSAEHSLERTVITAPLGGVAQRIDVEVGEYVRVGAPVLRIVDLSRIEVPVRLPASAAGLVRPGDTAELRGDAAGRAAAVWSGRVERIAPEADAATRTLTVFVVMEQDPADAGAALLQPGRFLTVAVSSSTTERRLVVPRRVVELDRVRVADPVDLDAEPEAIELARLRRVDLRAARRLMRVREAEVNVERYIDGRLPHLEPTETQWAVLAASGVAPERALAEGDVLLLLTGAAVPPGALIDVELVGEHQAGDSAEAAEPAGGRS